jgi:5-methylcytosine-specific restriction protein A
MPTSPLALCVEPGCSRLVPHGRCEEHLTEYRAAAEARRPRGRSNDYNGRWRTFSKDYLSRHLECESDRCLAIPWYARPTATQVDHIDGLGPSGPRGFDESNLRALCQSCHSSKTASTDGGFGNPRRSTPR